MDSVKFISIPVFIILFDILALAQTQPATPSLLIGYTEYRTNLPGGRPANVMSRRAFVIRADGTGRREMAPQLTAEPNHWSEVTGWSPDGRQVIIQTGWQSEENAAWERIHKEKRLDEGFMVDCCLVDIVTGETRNLTSVERVCHYNSSLFFWPGDRTKLGFVAVLAPGKEKIYNMNLDGTNKRDVSQEACGFSVSDDGKRIAYEKNYQLYLANADVSSEIKIQTGNPFNHLPLWSPDGRWVLFLSGRIHDSHPFVVQSDGTGLRKLGDRGGYEGWAPDFDIEDYRQSSDDFPCWSQDGKWVYYTARAGGAVELLRVSLDGKTERLTHSPAGTLTYDPKASPDGKWIAFGSTRDGIRQLYVAKPDGTAVRQLTRMPPGHAAKYFYWQTMKVLHR